jgi:hypothetical protein
MRRPPFATSFDLSCLYHSAAAGKVASGFTCALRYDALSSPSGRFLPPINAQFLINGEPFYSFRTAHYPYAEEVLDYADRHGVVVIDEAAAVTRR